MNKVLIPLALLGLVACGKHEPLNVPRIIGADESGQTEKNTKDIRKLKQQIKDLEDGLASTRLTIFGMLDEINDLKLDVASSGGDIDQLFNDIDVLESSVSTLSSNMVLQMTQLATLQGNTVTEIIDPCGKQASYDEVLLRVGSGASSKFLAYFEQGSNRFLAEIPNGNYRTTDGTNCNFTVNSGNVTF